MRISRFNVMAPGIEPLKYFLKGVYQHRILLALMTCVMPAYAQFDSTSKYKTHTKPLVRPSHTAHAKAHSSSVTKSYARPVTYRPAKYPSRSVAYPLGYYVRPKPVTRPMTKYQPSYRSIKRSKYHTRSDWNNTLHLWSVTASIGYTDFQHMYESEGQTVLGRLAFDRALLDTQFGNIGLELGVQNGNQMRLKVDEEDLNALGGSPIQTTVKPTLDLLGTFITHPLFNTPLFAQVKGGIAYRSWQFDDRTSIDFLSNIAGEVQAGVGFAISKTANLSLLYQGIYGGNPNFVVDTTNETGSISTLPIQNGVLLSLAVVV